MSGYRPYSRRRRRAGASSSSCSRASISEPGVEQLANLTLAQHHRQRRIGPRQLDERNQLGSPEGPAKQEQQRRELVLLRARRNLATHRRINERAHFATIDGDERFADERSQPLCEPNVASSRLARVCCSRQVLIHLFDGCVQGDLLRRVPCAGTQENHPFGRKVRPGASTRHNRSGAASFCAVRDTRRPTTEGTHPSRKEVARQGREVARQGHERAVRDRSSWWPAGSSCAPRQPEGNRS